MFQDINPPKKSVHRFIKRKRPSQTQQQAIDETVSLSMAAEHGNQKLHFQRLRNWWHHLGRNQRFAVVSILLLLFATGAIAFFYFTRPSTETSITIKKTKEVAPTTIASPLTGVQVAPELARRPVTGIMIENSLDARPQSGIQGAGVVVEAIAEGGITRFMALYQEGRPQYVGPVRSLRPYFLDFASPFQASIAHVGGSPDALGRVRSGHYRDIDQFFNPGYYWRVSSRAAPHNVYTSFVKLDALNKAKGYKKSTFTSWARKKVEGKALAVPTATSINIHMSGFYFNVHYDYNKTTNNYYRYEAGQKHLVTKSEFDKHAIQLHPKVVIALVMPYAIQSDGYHSIYDDVGTGRAYVFQDGGVTIGLWKKANHNLQIKFITTGGHEIKLEPGQTWITLISGTDKISYTAPKPAAKPKT